MVLLTYTHTFKVLLPIDKATCLYQQMRKQQDNKFLLLQYNKTFLMLLNLFQTFKKVILEQCCWRALSMKIF